MVPLYVKALAAPAELLKSTKQYPALLLSRLLADWSLAINDGLPGELVANHLDIDLLAETKPDTTNKIFVNPWLEFTHPVQEK